jgi:hypothetical protein
VAQSAEGPEEDPRAIEARKACATGEVDKGVKLLTDYLAATDDATAIYNIARCYEQNGIADKALLQFREYLRKARDLTDEDRRDVDAHINGLETRARPPLRVVTTAAAPPVRSPPMDDRRRVLRRLGLVAGGVGVAAVAAAVAFGLKVDGTNDDLRAELGKESPSADRFNQLQSRGSSAETTQWVLLGAGGALVVGGAICYLLGRPTEAERQVAVVPWMMTAAKGAGAQMRLRF